jgi:hypothetical protein
MVKPIPLRLRADQAERLIHRLARDSGNVILTTHAKERMAERDIVRHDLDRILRAGTVLEEPSRDRYGNWSCKIIHRLRGRRDAGAVTVIEKAKKLIVVTVEWEDVR